LIPAGKSSIIATIFWVGLTLHRADAAAQGPIGAAEHPAVWMDS
jgi:hypothetical protein